MKLRIWIPAILLVISSTYTIQYYYGIFNYYNQFTAEEDIDRGRLKLLLYGKVNESEHKTFDQLHDSFDVEIQRVTGERADASKINGIRQYNRTMLNHLSKLHGPKFIEELPYRFR